MLVALSTTDVAYHTPSPASCKVFCDGLLDGSATSTQQAQVASIHKEVAMYACFLHALGWELQHR